MPPPAIAGGSAEAFLTDLNLLPENRVECKNKTKYNHIILLYSYILLYLFVNLGIATPVSAAAFMLMDEMGREVKLNTPPERLIVLTSYPAEILCALGVGDKIVGICKPERHFLPGIRKKTSVGMSAVTPSLEKIFELNPDLVIAYQWTNREIVKKLEKLNIPVICSGAWTMEQIDLFIRQMGEIFGKKERSEELWGFMQGLTLMIQARTQLLDDSEKPAVFMEGTTPYQTTAVGQNSMETPWGTFMFESPMQNQITLAGGINCVGRQPVKSPRVSPEWVVEKDPDVFVKIAFLGTKDAIVSSEFMEMTRNEFMGREELKSMKAVKHGKVYVIHPRLCAGPMQVIGGCYYAKWLHPDLFRDLNPSAVHKEMLEKFWGTGLKGVWGVPYPQ